MSKIKTLNELAKENPDKTYNELTKIQEDARLKKEGVCVTAALKKDLSKEKEIDYHRYWKDMYEKEHKLRQEAQGETTIVKGIGMNSPEMKTLKSEVEALKQQLHTDRDKAQARIKELETILRSRDYTKQHDYKFLVNENKKLHKEVDEIKQDNKRLAHHIEDRIDRSRKAGM